MRKKEDRYQVCYGSGSNIPLNIQSVMRAKNIQHMPVCVLVNPQKNKKAIAQSYLDAVCGDYDLWGIFPHITSSITGINDRPMPLRGVLGPNIAGGIRHRAQKAGFIYASRQEKNDDSARFENAELGNISHGVHKVVRELNQRLGPDNPVIMHSDYCGNPYGDIDFPLACFMPDIRAQDGCEFSVLNNQSELKSYIEKLKRNGFKVSLNPSWGIRNF
ncbi:hypothetical protein [Fangia hongkongensis]|uniref:hypothetical protein n=1 Tax=Fangia hongkongensis TaxID=270495 RepID=UPI00036A2DD0|nr:hypothetical protein [Fangia hongkongensis]MBK2124649.1 hypothetical protein [Fangia hongkongensis]